MSNSYIDIPKETNDYTSIQLANMGFVGYYSNDGTWLTNKYIDKNNIKNNSYIDIPKEINIIEEVD